MTAPARMVRMVGDAEYRDQAEATLLAPGDTSMVFRSRPRSIVMACPDGCGERDGGCESHFIVWRGHILWCDRFEEGNTEPTYNPEIEDAVLSAMDEVQPRNAVELADAIDELVWDVNRAAGRLVGQGFARSWKIKGGWVFVRAA